MIHQGFAAVLSVAALFALAFAVRASGVAYRLSAETQRKMVHVGVGLHAMLLPWVIDRRGFLAFAVLALAALLILRIPRSATGGVGAAIHSVERRSWGDILFLAAVSVLFIRSAGDPEYYTLPLAVLTLSDAAAALIGTEYGRRFFGSTHRIKSIEGTAAFFVITWMVSTTILIFDPAVPRSNVVWLSTVVAAMAGLIEADSWHGLDNVFIPIGVYALLLRWGQAEPLTLGLIALPWLLILAGARWVARPLHLTPHALRVAFMALFLTAGFDAPVIVVLPVMALAGHVAARHLSGLGDSQHDLDFVAILVMVGLLWLVIGTLSRTPSTELYTMTFAALTAGYVVLAAPFQNRSVRCVVALIATGVVVPIQYWVSLRLPGGDCWMPRAAATIACAAAVAACGLAAACFPSRFLRPAGGLKLGALALSIPALAFGLLAPA